MKAYQYFGIMAVLFLIAGRIGEGGTILSMIYYVSGIIHAIFALITIIRNQQ